MRLTERYLQTPHSHWGDINSKYKVTLITYPDVCAWLGALWFTAGTGNDSLYTRLVERFEPLFTTQKNLQPNLSPRTTTSSTSTFSAPCPWRSTSATTTRNTWNWA